jgi:hypothetical protein
MSSAPATTLTLQIHRDTNPVTITVEGQTRELTLPNGAELPYRLLVDRAADAPAQLEIALAPTAETFDPNVTGACVLDIESSIEDRAFGTWDDTKYTLQLTNRSTFYVVEDLHIEIASILDAESGSTTSIAKLPDGNMSLAVTPVRQHIACIGPGDTKQLVFVAIARGQKPGLYVLQVQACYRLLYWDGRQALSTTMLGLPVQGPDVCFDLAAAPHPARMPRQPTSHRSTSMAQPARPMNVLVPPTPARPRYRDLKPIEQRCELHGGGQLKISYRLIKGNNPNADHCACSYGFNAETNTVESYFSTQDTAALEVIVENDSHHNLKHVRLIEIQLLHVNADDNIGGPVDSKLPDGNLFFELVPDDLYFGHLAPRQKHMRHLSLITRGVSPGTYVVHSDVAYDIEQCRAPLDLWLTVNPD